MESLAWLPQPTFLDLDIMSCCWKSKTNEPFAKCSIRDDMDQINREIVESDYLIIGTPVHMAYASSIMMTFLERICWTFAKPEKSYVKPSMTSCSTTSIIAANPKTGTTATHSISKTTEFLNLKSSLSGTHRNTSNPCYPRVRLWRAYSPS